MLSVLPRHITVGVYCLCDSNPHMQNALKTSVTHMSMEYLQDTRRLVRKNSDWACKSKDE